MTSAALRLPLDRFVDNQVYFDPLVHEREMDRIFARAWMFVCHESEVAAIGDFLTTEVAGNPIIVSRDRLGRVRAFYNSCRHRSSLVVMEASGHCAGFRCPYHFWVYSLEGELIGVPEESAYEGTTFRKEDFPLVGVRCESVHGLVFVNLGDDPGSLADWLGPEIIATLAKPLADARYEVFNRATNPTKANWKVWAENSRDGYHVPFVHPFFRKASPPGEYTLYPNGHAVQLLGMDPNGIEPDLWAKIRQHPLPGLEVGEGYIITLFPDLGITVRSNVVSIDSQVIEGPERVTLSGRQLGLVGDTDEMRDVRRLSWRAWFANPVELEDHPIFEAQQKGVKSRGVRYSIIARGQEKLSGLRGDDNRLRHFWTQWRAMMGTNGNSLGTP